MDKNVTENWAILEVMGHERTAGLIKTSDIGGLVRIEVPIGDGFRTEYYGEKAIYAIRIVSEEIARAYAPNDREVSTYDAPIIPRSQFHEAMQRANNLNDDLRNEVEVLKQRLVTVNSIPSKTE